MKRTVRAAFRATIPVLMGYLAIGIAFGLMMDAAGYSLLLTVLMSVTIYAGAGQYLGVSLLVAGASPVQTALLTLLVNFRHMFYGLSMLEKFHGMGLRKLYMIFSLTDETYALLSSARAGGRTGERLLPCHRPAGPQLLDYRLRAGLSAGKRFVHQHHRSGLRYDGSVRGHCRRPVAWDEKPPAGRHRLSGDAAQSPARREGQYADSGPGYDCGPAAGPAKEDARR